MTGSQGLRNSVSSLIDSSGPPEELSDDHYVAGWRLGREDGIRAAMNAVVRYMRSAEVRERLAETIISNMLIVVTDADKEHLEGYLEDADALVSAILMGDEP